MRYTLAIALLSLMTVCARAQDKPTIDEQIAKLLELKQQQAELKKQEETISADLKKRFDELRDQLNKLGVIDPQPKPPEPKPPGPKPPEPAPVDPLGKKLRDAFDADPPLAEPETKREYGKLLAALYNEAATLARDDTVGTSGELLLRVMDAAARLLKDPPTGKKLAGTRRIVNLELATILPTDESLTAEQRVAVAAILKKIALILDSF